jgi:hypothetical protein
MNTNKINIIWEKWKDPLGFDENETSEYEEKAYDDDGASYETNHIKKIKCHLISTPLGIIPFNETTSSSDVFNFWTGHTNFAITKLIGQIIENTPGVETLNIFTKYRFRIGIGKAFSDSVVMRKINNNVYNFLAENEDYVK